MADHALFPTDDRGVFLFRVLTVIGKLPPELIVKILYEHRGLSSPTAICWRTEPGHASRLEIHRDLVAHRAIGASESRCWCADFSISSLLAELHAFGTPHQSALSRKAARHSTPARPPDNFTAYRKRCSMASLLTRIATADSPLLSSRVPPLGPRIGRDASAPFIPINHRRLHSAVLAWFACGGIPILTDDPTSVPELVREYYRG